MIALYLGIIVAGSVSLGFIFGQGYRKDDLRDLKQRNKELLIDLEQAQK